jgi:lipopolysaccharide assembly protein B
MKNEDWAEAAKRFEAAIELDATVLPAYVHLGDVRTHMGDPAGAARIWEESLDVSPDRAYLALDRLENIYAALGGDERFAQLCRRLIAATPREWRARAALARHLSSAGEPGKALELMFEALEHNPHALAIHQAIWNILSALDLPRPLVARYIDLTRRSVFYLDPHVCVRCRYRSTELLWQCPHCHEWNTFIEERITPATDEETEIPAGLTQ